MDLEKFVNDLSTDELHKLQKLVQKEISKRKHLNTSISIDNAEMSTRLLQVLKKTDIKDLHEFEEITSKQALKLRGMGPKLLNELSNLLHSKNLNFKIK